MVIIESFIGLLIILGGLLIIGRLRKLLLRHNNKHFVACNPESKSDMITVKETSGQSSEEIFHKIMIDSSDLLAGMDYTYFNLRKNLPDISIMKSENIHYSRFEGRWLGFIMAFVCDKMEEELHKAQLFMDFPHCYRTANAIFKLPGFGRLDIHIPDKLFPFDGDDFQDNPLALHNIYAKMTEEERTIIKELEIKGRLSELQKLEIDQREQGTFDGMIVYMKHLPLSTLIEDVDIIQEKEC